MKTLLFASALLAGFSTAAAAHNVLSANEGEAGFLFPMTLNVNHGCKGEPVVGLRLKIPDGIVETKAAEKQGWTIEYKMRKLD